MTFVERKTTLSGELHEFPCTLLARTEREAVILYRLPEDGRVEDLVLPQGTISLGYFWADRDYNAYHWLTPEGRTLGVYFNLSAETRITADRVAWLDLVVDVLATPDGRVRVLDEAELPGEIEPRLADRIERAKRHLTFDAPALVRDIEARSRDHSAERDEL